MSTDLGTSLKATGAMASLKNEEPTCPRIDFIFYYKILQILYSNIIF